MTSFDFGLWFIIGLCAFAAFASIIPKSTDEAMRDFTRQCADSGMDSEETGAAVAIRVAFARLRRMASDLCLDRNGDISRAQINEIAGTLAIGIGASYGKDAAHSFIGWVDACPDHEILYDDARAARHRKLMQSVDLKPTADPHLEDDIKAAFRIVK